MQFTRNLVILFRIDTINTERLQFIVLGAAKLFVRDEAILVRILVLEDVLDQLVLARAILSLVTAGHLLLKVVA